MFIFEQLSVFFQQIFILIANPFNVLILCGAVLLGIIFGAMPGLTATLGVALLATLTYGMDTSTSLVALLSIYVGAIYGGSYASILINIPGTAAAYRMKAREYLARAKAFLDVYILQTTPKFDGKKEKVNYKK